MLAKDACLRSCAVCGDGCHLKYGANLASLGNNGRLSDFAGLTKYLSKVVAKIWDLNRLHGDFFKSYTGPGSLCGKQFDVLKQNTNRIETKVIVNCGGDSDLLMRERQNGNVLLRTGHAFSFLSMLSVPILLSRSTDVVATLGLQRP